MRPKVGTRVYSRRNKVIGTVVKNEPRSPVSWVRLEDGSEWPFNEDDLITVRGAWVAVSLYIAGLIAMGLFFRWLCT